MLIEDKRSKFIFPHNGQGALLHLGDYKVQYYSPSNI